MLKVTVNVSVAEPSALVAGKTGIFIDGIIVIAVQSIGLDGFPFVHSVVAILLAFRVTFLDHFCEAVALVNCFLFAHFLIFCVT